VTFSTFDSWIATEHPYAIVYGAAQTIFRMIGKTDEARGMKEEVAEHYRTVLVSGIKEEGE
jgi:hypothetical protein